MLSAELSVAELALRKRVRESAWFDHHHLDFRLPFAAADVHGHGRLSVPEFQDAVARLGVAMSPQELNNLARRLDTNADGTIDYYEFAKLIDLDPSELYVAFRLLLVDACVCRNASVCLCNPLGSPPPAVSLPPLISLPAASGRRAISSRLQSRHEDPSAPSPWEAFNMLGMWSLLPVLLMPICLGESLCQRPSRVQYCRH